MCVGGGVPASSFSLSHFCSVVSALRCFSLSIKVSGILTRASFHLLCVKFQITWVEAHCSNKPFPRDKGINPNHVLSFNCIHMDLNPHRLENGTGMAFVSCSAVCGKQTSGTQLRFTFGEVFCTTKGSLFMFHLTHCNNILHCDTQLCQPLHSALFVCTAFVLHVSVKGC